MSRWFGEAGRAVRRLRRTPAFSSTLIAVVAVSTAIMIAVSQLATAVFREAVPYDKAERLVNLHEFNEGQGNDYMLNSWPTVAFWQENATVFERIGVATAPSNLTLAKTDGSERIVGGLVSPEVFDVLGVEMRAGRPFGSDEEGQGTAARAVVVSSGFWDRELGSAPGAIGSTINVNGSAWTVVGVLPPGLPLLPTVPVEVDVWLPAAHAEVVFGQDISQVHSFRVFTTLALIGEGVSRVRVDEEVATFSRRLAEMFPETSGDWTWRAQALSEVVTQDLRGPTATLLAGAVVLLLVALTNVTGLLVQRARMSARGASVRLAVGGSRSDLARIASVEAGLLIGTGVTLGIVVGQLALVSHGQWMPFPLPPHIELGLDPFLILAAVIAASLMTFVAGRVTGWWWWRAGDSGTTGAHLGGPRSVWRAARVGLGLQAALAALLTVTALLTTSSFMALADADVGFEPSDLLFLRVDVPSDLRPRDQLSRTADDILRELGGLGGVRQAALWSPHVPAAAVWSSRVAVFDRSDLQEPGDQPLVRIHQVGHQAATLLGLEFAAGRDFTLADRTSGRRVALVSETAAKEWWGDEQPLGRLIRRWSHEEWSEVVGVIRDAPLSGRQGAGAVGGRDVMFLHDQDPQPFMVFLLRTGGESGDLVRRAQEAVRGIASDLPVYSVRYMSELVEEQEGLPRSTALLGAVFAVAALLLVGVGLYGVLSHFVAERSAEISLRKALGATSVVIVRQVVMPAMTVVLAGAAGGLLSGRVLLPRWLSDSLFQVSAEQWGLYLSSGAILLGVVVPALVEPAFRGSRKNPVDALRRGSGV